MRTAALCFVCWIGGLGTWAASPTQEPDSRVEDDTLPIEIVDVSVWIVDPSRERWNDKRAFRNAMPSVVGTIRTTPGNAERVAPDLAPVSVMQVFGEPVEDLDIELRLGEGGVIAHWPPATDRGNRLRWFGVDLGAEPPRDLLETHIPEDHWFSRLRGQDEALYVIQDRSYERFLAYDAELTNEVPIRLRGGPDRYTLQNLSGRPLRDVAVIAPTERGVRIGWLDELPTAVEPDPSAEDSEEDDAEDENADPGERAEAFFAEAESDDPAEEPLPPLPAEADPAVRRQVEEQLNRPISLALQQVALRDALEETLRATRLPFEIEDRAIAAEEIDVTEPTDVQAVDAPARDVLAEVLGPAGLSYRITERGRLFVTTAARLTEALADSDRAVEGPPVELLVSQPVEPSEPSHAELTRDALERRWLDQGLRRELAEAVLDEYQAALFEPDELIVLLHLPRGWIDELTPLDVFPVPERVERLAMLVVRGIDPRLQERARELVRQLGDPSAERRDAAEARLLEIGPAVIPALEDALLEDDLEIVFRAERLLLKFQRPVP